MWIFTNRGMLSVVSERPDAAMLLVRARAKGHIEAAFPDAKVTRTVHRDYRYRARVPRKTVARVIAAQIAAIDYPNFKDSVRDDAYHDACAGAWGVMFRYQMDQERKPKRAAQQRVLW